MFCMFFNGQQKKPCISKAQACVGGKKSISEANTSHTHTPGISSAQPFGGRQPQYADNA